MDVMDRRDELQDEIRRNPKQAPALQAQLKKIENILGANTEVEDDDDLLDLWQEQLARGETPDFSKRVN